MQVVVILGFAVTLSLLVYSRSLPRAGWWTPAAFGAYYLVLVALKGLDTSVTSKLLKRQSRPSRRSARWAGLLSTVPQVWLVAGSAMTIFLGFGWWIHEDLGLRNVPLVGKLVGVAPFLAGVLVFWLLEYPTHRLARMRASQMALAAGEQARPIWSLGAFLVFNLRHHVLFVAVPVSLIILLADCLTIYLGPRVQGWRWADLAVTGGTVAGALVVFLLAPLMVVRIWKTRPLPDGSTRWELERMCSLLSLRYRRLMVWQSGGVVANAGVLGVAGPVRYILLSDALLDSMHPEQVKSIFAHEAGHVVHHHIFYALLYAVSTVVLSDAVGLAVSAWLGWGEWAYVAFSLGLLLVLWGVGFGWLSRRFERQSDVVAAWSAGPPPQERDAPDEITPEGAATFAGALEEVARLNQIPRNQRNWRHGSIAWRVAHVLHLGATRGSRAPVDRLIRRVKVALWIGLGVSLAASLAVYRAAGQL